MKSRSTAACAVPRATTCCSALIGRDLTHCTSIGPVALRVGGGVTRVQRITRSVSGSPLAIPWRNSRTDEIRRRLLGANGKRNERGGRSSALNELPARNRHGCLVILMHVRDARTACLSAPIPQEHVEGDRRAVRLAQVVGDEIAGHVAADAEAARRSPSRDRARSRP